MSDQPQKNTDKKIWGEPTKRDSEGGSNEGMEPYIFITERNTVGMNYYGKCSSNTIKDWVELSWRNIPTQSEERERPECCPKCATVCYGECDCHQRPESEQVPSVPESDLNVTCKERPESDWRDEIESFFNENFIEEEDHIKSFFIYLISRTIASERKMAYQEGLAEWYIDESDATIRNLELQNKRLLENNDILTKKIRAAKREAYEEAIGLSDKIELQYETEFNEWRAFKRFRNELRDRLASQQEPKD